MQAGRPPRRTGDAAARGRGAGRQRGAGQAASAQPARQFRRRVSAAQPGAGPRRGRAEPGEQQLQQAKLDLLQLESTYAPAQRLLRLRSRTKTSAVRHSELATQIAEARQTQAAAAARAGEERRQLEAAHVAQSRAHNEGTPRSTPWRRRRCSSARASGTCRSWTARWPSARRGCGCSSSCGKSGRDSGRGQRRCCRDSSTPPGRPQGQARHHGLEVKPEYGQALEALLGSAVEAVAWPGCRGPADSRAPGRQKIGSACLQWRRGNRRTGEARPRRLPAFLQPATIALASLDPAHPIAGVLAACYIAESLDEFLEYWRANPDFPIPLGGHAQGRAGRPPRPVYGGHSKARPAASCSAKSTCARRRGSWPASRAHDEQRALVEKLGARRWPRPKRRWSSTARTCSPPPSRSRPCRPRRATRTRPARR